MGPGERCANQSRPRLSPGRHVIGSPAACRRNSYFGPFGGDATAIPSAIQVRLPFSEKGISEAIAAAQEMRCLKATIVPNPGIIE